MTIMLFDSILSWVKDMFLFGISASLVGVNYSTAQWQNGDFMTELPKDRYISSNACYIHYTYGIIIKDTNN